MCDIFFLLCVGLRSVKFLIDAKPAPVKKGVSMWRIGVCTHHIQKVSSAAGKEGVCNIGVIVP